MQHISRNVSGDSINTTGGGARIVNQLQQFKLSAPDHKPLFQVGDVVRVDMCSSEQLLSACRESGAGYMHVLCNYVGCYGVVNRSIAADSPIRRYKVSFFHSNTGSLPFPDNYERLPTTNVKFNESISATGNAIYSHNRHVLRIAHALPETLLKLVEFGAVLVPGDRVLAMRQSAKPLNVDYWYDDEYTQVCEVQAYRVATDDYQLKVDIFNKVNPNQNLVEWRGPHGLVPIYSVDRQPASYAEDGDVDTAAPRTWMQWRGAVTHVQEPVQAVQSSEEVTECVRLLLLACYRNDWQTAVRCVNEHPELLRACLTMLVGEGEDAERLTGTPLYVASVYGHVQIVHALLLRGAEPSDADNYRCTALHAAVLHDRQDCLNILLPIAIKDGTVHAVYSEQALTPIMLAIQHNRHKVLSLLLPSADLTARDRDGQNLLHQAVQAGRRDAPAPANTQTILTQLLALPVAHVHRWLRERNGQNMCPLELAVSVCSTVAVSALLEVLPQTLVPAANPVDGCNILHLCAEQGDPATLQVLCQYLTSPDVHQPQQVNGGNRHGQTPLHVVLSQMGQHWELIYDHQQQEADTLNNVQQRITALNKCLFTLLQHKADPTQTDNDQMTPIVLAFRAADAHMAYMNVETEYVTALMAKAITSAREQFTEENLDLLLEETVHLPQILAVCCLLLYYKHRTDTVRNPLAASPVPVDWSHLAAQYRLEWDLMCGHMVQPPPAAMQPVHAQSQSQAVQQWPSTSAGAASASDCAAVDLGTLSDELRQYVETLRKENELLKSGLDPASTCKICSDRQVTHILPCGHCYCEECILIKQYAVDRTAVRECYVCRQKGAAKKIFL